MSRVIEYATTYRDGTCTTTCYTRSDGIRLYKYSDNTWGVAFQGTWLPGKYADRDAALLAVDCPRTALEKAVHYSVRGIGLNYRPLTVNDLKEVK